MVILNLIGKLLLKLYVNTRILLIFCLLPDQRQRFLFKSFGRVEIIKKFSNISSLSSIPEDFLILLLEFRKGLQSFGEWLKWNYSIDSVLIQREILKRLWIHYRLFLIFSTIWFWEKNKFRLILRSFSLHEASVDFVLLQKSLLFSLHNCRVKSDLQGFCRYEFFVFALFLVRYQSALG